MSYLSYQWDINGPLIQIYVGSWAAERMPSSIFRTKDSHIKTNVLDPLRVEGFHLPDSTIKVYFEHISALHGLNPVKWLVKAFSKSRVEVCVGLYSSGKEFDFSSDSIKSVYEWLKNELRQLLVTHKTDIQDTKSIGKVIDESQKKLMDSGGSLDALAISTAYYYSVLHGYQTEAALALSTYGYFYLTKEYRESIFLQPIYPSEREEYLRFNLNANLQYQLKASELCHQLRSSDSCLDGQMHYNAALAYYFCTVDGDNVVKNYSNALEQFRLALGCADKSHHHPFMLLSVLGMAEIYHTLDRDKALKCLEICEDMINEDAKVTNEELSFLQIARHLRNVISIQQLSSEQADTVFAELHKYILPIIQGVLKEFIFFITPGNSVNKGKRIGLIGVSFYKRINNVFHGPTQIGQRNIQILAKYK